MSILASITSDNKRCKASSFEIRARIKNYVSPEEYKKIEESLKQAYKNKTVVDYEGFLDIDDGEKHEWYSIGDDKFRRVMYCKKTGIFRFQTMGEFYENTTVD